MQLQNVALSTICSIVQIPHILYRMLVCAATRSSYPQRYYRPWQYCIVAKNSSAVDNYGLGSNVPHHWISVVSQFHTCALVRSIEHPDQMHVNYYPYHHWSDLLLCLRALLFGILSMNLQYSHSLCQLILYYKFALHVFSLVMIFISATSMYGCSREVEVAVGNILFIQEAI